MGCCSCQVSWDRDWLQGYSAIGASFLSAGHLVKQSDWSQGLVLLGRCHLSSLCHTHSRCLSYIFPSNVLLCILKKKKKKTRLFRELLGRPALRQACVALDATELPSCLTCFIFLSALKKHRMRKIKQRLVKARRRWGRRYNGESVRLLSKGRWGTSERWHSRLIFPTVYFMFYFHLPHPPLPV